jgi:Holliday junction resolvasome RuvABC ATP-dependent DNA helicase subunit
MSKTFANVIGQERIKSRLMASINAPEDAKLAQVGLYGQAGLGKTQIGRAYANALAEKHGWEILAVTPEMLRLSDSPFFIQFKHWLAADTGILLMDEIHELSGINTVQMQKILSFLLKALDEQNEGSLITFDADESYYFDKSKKVIIGMTNHKDKMSSALVSRMAECDLQPYSTEEMQNITLFMLANNGMTVDSEKTLKVLAMASKGTARPLDNMVNHFALLGQETITLKIAIQAMIDLNMFPKGLTRDEVRLIELAQQAKPKAVLRLQLPNLTTFNDSIAYMMGLGFLELHGQNIKTTTGKKSGTVFLQQLRASGFLPKEQAA